MRSDTTRTALTRAWAYDTSAVPAHLRDAARPMVVRVERLRRVRSHLGTDPVPQRSLGTAAELAVPRAHRSWRGSRVGSLRPCACLAATPGAKGVWSS